MPIRVTQEFAEVRDWVVSRNGWPCRRLDGGLALGFRNDICRGVAIGWDEFVVVFRGGRLALAFEEEAGSTRWLIAQLADARRFAAEASSRAEPARSPVQVPAAHLGLG